jgi:(p)ppGpp synthase/HD superfamily hydrolase
MILDLQKHEEYQRAVELAAYWHQQSPMTEGIRPDIYYPYICHCISVANYVAWGLEKDKIELDGFPILALALLHDTLEDTPIPESELTGCFPDPDFLLCMKAITDNPTLPPDQQLEDSLQRIINLPWKLSSLTKMVKLADCCANVDIRITNNHLMSGNEKSTYSERSLFILGMMSNSASTSLQTLLTEKIENFGLLM